MNTLVVLVRFLEAMDRVPSLPLLLYVTCCGLAMTERGNNTTYCTVNVSGVRLCV